MQDYNRRANNAKPQRPRALGPARPVPTRPWPHNILICTGRAARSALASSTQSSSEAVACDCCGASIWNGKGTLIVEDLADAGLLLLRKRARIVVQLGARRHAALNAGTCPDVIDPALEVLEFVYVLALPLETGRPGIAGYIGNGEFVSGKVAPVAQRLLRTP